MTPYSLPLRIRRVAEAFVVEDAQATNLAYVYFEEDPKRTGITRRLAVVDAQVVAQRIARALTGEAGS
jgi:hypothetical protein